MFKYHSKSLRCQQHSYDVERCPLHMPESHRFVSILPMFHGDGIMEGFSKVPWHKVWHRCGDVVRSASYTLLVWRKRYKGAVWTPANWWRRWEGGNGFVRVFWCLTMQIWTMTLGGLAKLGLEVVMECIYIYIVYIVLLECHDLLVMGMHPAFQWCLETSLFDFERSF